MNETPLSTDAGDRDARLVRLLEDALAQCRGGQQPQVETLCRQHPDLAGEIRELWTTAAIAEDFGSAVLEARDSSELETLLLSPFEGARDSGVPAAGRFGEYELLDELGRGGMGVVFKARQTSLDRLVALKMILRGALATEGDVARFRAEAESAARLKHPHIVPVFEVGEHDGQPYFSMEYVAGTTLARRLADGPLPPRDAARLLAPVCRAIAEAHRHGIVHRDLKPSNILIDGQGRSCVSDFGLAKRLPMPETGARNPLCEAPAGPLGQKIPEPFLSLTVNGAILGTPSYMAPEQAAGSRGEVSPATDVYSLGAMLYAMLTGRPPFEAASPVDTVLMVLEQDPVPPRVLNQRADADLELIALKCLQKPVDLRYGSADELADDLEAYLADEPISARSSHFTQVISRIFRETHHAGVLENWGLLWMWHSLALLVLCLTTNAIQLAGVASRWPYVGLWTLGLGVWALIFWNLRRRGGPITFVERQIAHVWAGSMAASSLLFGVEALLEIDVLGLSPVLALIAGMVFVVKAGILSGVFYVQAIALFLTAVAMVLLRDSNLPDFSISLFGLVSAVAFFVPGWKYHRQRLREANHSL